MKKYVTPYLEMYNQSPREKVCTDISGDDTGFDIFDEENEEQG